MGSVPIHFLIAHMNMKHLFPSATNGFESGAINYKWKFIITVTTPTNCSFFNKPLFHFPQHEIIKFHKRVTSELKSPMVLRVKSGNSIFPSNLFIHLPLLSSSNTRERNSEMPVLLLYDLWTISSFHFCWMIFSIVLNKKRKEFQIFSNIKCMHPLGIWNYYGKNWKRWKFMCSNCF